MASISEIQAALANARRAGAPQAVIDQLNSGLQQALQSSGAPTREQISTAYYNALNAGNTDAARQIIGYVQQHGMTVAPMTPDQENVAFQKQNAQNVASQSPIQTALQGAGKAAVATGRGVGQILGIESPQDIADAQQADQALMNTTAGRIGNLAGQGGIMYVGGSLLKGALGAARVAQKALPYVSSALAGGAFSGAQPAIGSESRGMNTVEGALLGAGGEAVPGVLGAAAKKAAPTMSLAKRAALNTAERYNIPLHLSQVAGGRFTKTLGAAAKYLPFSGATAADEAQRMAFNRALASTVGQNADELTPEVMQAAKAENSSGYNSLFGRNTVNLRGETWRRLGQIADAAQKDLPPDQAQVVLNQIAKFTNAARENGGNIPGRLYQNLRATVQKVEGQNQPSKYLVGQVRKVMQDAANSSFKGDDAAKLQALNGQFSNLKILDKALGQNQGANYSVTPANIWRLANTKYGATPEMTDLAQLGQTVLKDPVANSGTAQRELAYRYLLGGDVPLAFFSPHAAAAMATPAAAGMTIGRILNSPLAARTLPYAGQNLLLGLSRVSQPANRLLPLLSAQAPAVPVNAGFVLPIATPQQ